MKILRRDRRPVHIPIALLRILLALTVALLAVTLLAYQPALNQLSSSSHRHPPIVTPQSPIPFLGINTALEGYNPTERQVALARLHATGFGWARQRFDWARLEPSPDHYDWSLSDALIHDILAADLVPVIVLDGSPRWARAPQDRPPTDNPLAPPADYRDFARFVAAFATRYRDQLTFYQIWDEPNIAPHWGNRLIEPVAYAQLLRVTATAIRRADPDATILSAALAPTLDRGHNAIDEIYYLQRLYAAGAAPYIDVLAIQPFGFGASPTDERIGVDRLNFGRAQLIRQTMVAAGAGATPLWAVRYGWNRQLASPWATVSEADQADFAVNAVTRARTEWPWLTAMAWVIDQPDAPATDPQWGFALSPRLANAFQQRSPSLPIEHSPLPIDHALWPTFGYLAALLIAGWRMALLGCQLPWPVWQARYHHLPVWIQLLLWSLLAVAYYFAFWPPLILLCWMVAATLFWWQPSVGLWLAATLIPFYAQHKEFALGIIHVALAPSHALLLCLLPVGVARIRQICQGERVMGSASGNTYYAALALLWLLINLLSAVNRWPWSAYWEGMGDLVVMPLLGWALAMLLLDHRRGPSGQAPVLVASALFVGGLAVAGGGLLLWLRGEGTAVDGVLRLTGPYFSPNQAALYLERTFFIGLGLLVMLPRYRVAMLAALITIFTALLLTASRGALFLGLPAALLLFGSGWILLHRAAPPAQTGAVAGLSRRNRLPVVWRLYLLGIGLLLAITIPILLRSSVGDRLTNSTTILQRWMTWQSSWALWLDHFWIGVGPGGFFWRYPAYLPLGALDEPNLHHPHNLWLELATGWGVGGLIWLALLLAYLIHCYRRFLRATEGQAGQPTNWLSLSLLAAITAGIVHAQVDAFLVQPDLALWNWLVLALLHHLTQSNK